MYRTVVGVVAVLTDTEAGAAGTEVTVTRICCWLLLSGAWAMHPAKESSRDTAINDNKTTGKNFRTGPSGVQKAIKNVRGRNGKFTP